MNHTATASSNVKTDEVSGGSSNVVALSTPEKLSKKPTHTRPHVLELPVPGTTTGGDDNIEMSSVGSGQEASGGFDQAACKPEVSQLVAETSTAWNDLASIDPEFAPMKLAQANLLSGMLLDPGAEAYGGDPEGWGWNPIRRLRGFIDDIPGALHSAARHAVKRGLKVVTKHGLTMVKLAAGTLVPLAVQAIGGPGAVAMYQGLSGTMRSAYDEWQKRNDKRGKKPNKAKIQAVLDQLDRMESAQESAPMDMESLVAILDTVSETAEAIIGEDDRVQISATEGEPWRRICALRICFPSGACYKGTGFFIGSRAVATAGHCVYLKSQGGWADTVEVIPGADGDEAPFGRVVATDMRSVTGWVSDRKPESDYGCIVLPEGSFGHADLGSFGYGAFAASELVGTGAVISGYPGDKPFGEAWSAGRAISSVASETLHYDIDTFGGQSGAPVYVMRNGMRFAVGIHNYGGRVTNSATRITPARYQRLNAWANIA